MSPHLPPSRPSPGRGFTVLEAMVAVAIMAILTALAVPSMGHMAARHRLAAATHALTADLRQAREDAVHRGVPVYVNTQAGTHWCWAVSTEPGCDCSAADTRCMLRGVDGREFPGVTLEQALPVSFDPQHGRSSGGQVAALRTTAAGAVAATQVHLHPAGRPRACSSGTPLRGFDRCG